MPEGNEGYRFYADLASWWPVISPREDYQEEAEVYAGLLEEASIPVRQVLELGSGGGHNASYLKQHFEMILVDLSAEMLAVSRRLNPECDHTRGDMRSIRLGRDFDAVFIHDAVTYMLSEDDLRAVMETAFLHCRPGGTVVVAPDDVRETYAAGTDYGGSDGPDGRAARYLEWSWDPDPADTETVTEYVFLLRSPGGAVEVVHETHRFGLFGRDDWLRHLAEAGFVRTAVQNVRLAGEQYELFVGHRPP